ncbi:MAG: hypothetical protein JW783_00375 [Bacteroidales bacterium]|nr:hypothetical protein [Bacteroidales bacterium]MBN2748476.1 hypothetical protein [Bacteroidales bacterium]
MARTVDVISAEIKAAFVASDALASAYALDKSKTFDEQFSKVSLEALIINVVAYAHYVIERIVDSFRVEIDERIAATAVATPSWYDKLIRQYQHGQPVVFKAQTYSFGYSSINEDTQIIKYVAIREVEDEGVTKLRIYVSKADKVPLTADELAAFTAYLKYVSPAGIHFDFVSSAPDLLELEAQVIYDPLLISSTGAAIGSEAKPVNDAIINHIDGLIYGGILQKSKLIDSIQAVSGVYDINLTALKRSTDGGTTFEDVTGLEVAALSGAFSISPESINITYSPRV